MADAGSVEPKQPSSDFDEIHPMLELKRGTPIGQTIAQPRKAKLDSTVAEVDSY